MTITKPMTKAEFRAASLAFWCQCPEPQPTPYYVPDNQRTDCSKHHWRCPQCDKIQQVG
jgi:hypothetical protein